MIDFRTLRYVLALGEHRNFARAAESLHVSQPALSRGIAGLEQDLGVQLFDRLPSGVEPTACGRLVIDRGKEIIEKESDLRREIVLMQGIEVGELSIGAGPFPFAISVSKAVGMLVARYPNLKIRIDQDSPPAIVGRVLGGEVDLGLLDSLHCRDDARLAIELLPAHTVVCCCRRNHPLAGKRKPALGEVLAYPLIGTVFSRSVGAILSCASNAGRIDEASGKFFPAVTVASLCAAREIALACDAVLPISPTCTESELESGDLVIIDFTEPWMQVQYGFVSKKDRTHSPAMIEFMGTVRAVEQAAIEREAALIAAYANFGNLRNPPSGNRRASSR